MLDQDNDFVDTLDEDADEEREDVDFSSVLIGQGGAYVDDAMRMYLRELGRVPLLTAEQEVFLAQRIKRAMRERSRAASLGIRPDQAALLAGEEARHRFVEANLRLVVSIAQKYVGRGISLADLIQEGNTGLIQAVEKFDATKGFRFSTYASWQIRHTIVRALENQGRTIRLPVHVVQDLNQIRTASRTLTVELGREPTTEEIARKIGVSPHKIEEFRQFIQEPISLETPVGDEGESAIGDFVEDDSLSSSEVVAQQELREQVAMLLQDLNERERTVIQMRYGFLDGESHTLEEVGRVLNLTRERARQIEAKALKKLRANGSGKELQDFLG